MEDNTPRAGEQDESEMGAQGGADALNAAGEAGGAAASPALPEPAAAIEMQSPVGPIENGRKVHPPKTSKDQKSFACGESLRLQRVR